MQTAYFAAGCFWCVEAIFQRVEGVLSVVSGYCNGNTKNPTYADICSGSSGYAESIKIDFDSSVITFKALLEVFFATHDPTTLNQQGNDIGSQYRSAIFYTDDEQRQCAYELIQKMAGNIVTEIAPLSVFYQAENEHQNYFNNNPAQPYCQLLIAPKIKKYFK